MDASKRRRKPTDGATRGATQEADEVARQNLADWKRERGAAWVSGGDLERAELEITLDLTRRDAEIVASVRRALKEHRSPKNGPGRPFVLTTGRQAAEQKVAALHAKLRRAWRLPVKDRVGEVGRIIEDVLWVRHGDALAREAIAAADGPLAAAREIVARRMGLSGLTLARKTRRLLR